MKPIRVLCVGAGHMGASHARAYHALEGFEIAGIVTRSPEGSAGLNAALGANYDEYRSFEEGLAASRPDAVSVSSWPDTHEAFALAALDAGCHVFCEKPLADTVAGAERVVARARERGRKLVVGYILRHHPSWERFTELARGLGKPLVMRMNLNQQSSGAEWRTHRALIASVPPIVDCGVHYVDVMCRMTGARPLRVSGIGARLTEDLPPGALNYGQLQVVFDDGSVGWYEAGWGPMMSETAFFVKDVVGPRGSVSIVAEGAAAEGRSANVDAHTQTQALRIHHGALDGDGRFAREDEVERLDDEPDHDELCRREQEHFLRAIREDLDLGAELEEALLSMRIVDAADRSFREGRMVEV